MNAKDTIFFNIDTQKDFLNSDGALYVKDAELIKPELLRLTEIADQNNIKVINTADFHTDQSKEISETPDFVNTFPKHCMIGSDGTVFIEETIPFATDSYIIHYTDSKIDEKQFNFARNIIIFKDAFDVFAGNKLTDDALVLIQKDIIVENIVVYGVATNICVAFAIDGLLKRKFKVFLVMDAIKGLPGSSLEDLYVKWLDQGVILTTTKQIEKMICLNG